MNLKLPAFILLMYLLEIHARELLRQASSASTNTTTATTKSVKERYLDLRKDKTMKDADLVIKMTGDFIRDMQGKMTIVKRVERTYENSADFSTASLYDDIQKRFKHMCDLYKEFATVDRYVLGNKVNDTAESVDVALVYQIMLSDYNEILMLMELFKVEQLAWSAGNEDLISRELIKKQMLKFGNLPARVTAPRLVEDLGLTTSKSARRWESGSGRPTQNKWSGELDGVSLDDR